MVKVLGIGGVFFKSDDPEGLYAWYEKHLGLQHEAGGPVIFPWRHAAASDISGSDEPASEKPGTDKRGTPDEPGKPGMTVWSLFPRDSDYFGPTSPAFMVNYIVDDIDGMLTHLRAAGAQVDDRREDSEYGRFAWVTDPEGNRIELWEPPK